MANIKKVPLRKDADPNYTWATEDIYPSDEAWTADAKKLLSMLENISSYEGTLASSAENLLKFFRLYEDVLVVSQNISHYAARKKDEDTKNPIYQSMDGQAASLRVETSRSTSFLKAEVMQISDDALEHFFEEEKELAAYRRAIMEIRRRKEHILSAELEELLASAGELSNAPGNIYSFLNDADLSFPSIRDSQGNELEVTHGTFLPLLMDSDVAVRKAAFESLYHTYENFKNTSAAILSAQVKQLIFFAKARKYNSTLEASLHVTNVPVDVYHNLIKTVHENMHYMHKYVGLHKRALKLEALHMYDLYTPMIPEAAAAIPFEEAKKNVLAAMAPLGKDYQALIEEGFNNRWIDVYENVGKRSGAYSAGARVHPFVLLNYKDNLKSQFTLAHEMGHAIHSYLSNHTQRVIDSSYVTFAAEVASTCNEALLIQYLLKGTQDKMQRAYLINYFLDKFKSTLYRQTMFAEFELAINEMAQQGQALTADSLCRFYYGLNQDYYGEEVVIDSEISLEWARIPHFFYNYYVFQYATGFSAAIALAQKILEEGEPAAKKYLRFLSSGCSKDPISLLRDAGVDMASPEPIKEALALFGSLMEELEELLA